MVQLTHTHFVKKHLSLVPCRTLALTHFPSVEEQSGPLGGFKFLGYHLTRGFSLPGLTSGFRWLAGLRIVRPPGRCREDRHRS